MALDSIPPHDTIVVHFQVTADSLPRSAELFSMQFVNSLPDVVILPPVNNETIAVIQTPARLELQCEIISALGAGPLISYGETFHVAAHLVNHGQGQISGGAIALDYSPASDFRYSSSRSPGTQSSRRTRIATA